MKYIPADKLIAEIETRKNNNLISASKCPTGYFSLVANEDIEILGIVNSLLQEQPEVELEREVKDYFMGSSYNLSSYECWTIARHFYELGLNARKEE